MIQGSRGSYFVVNMAEATQMTSYAEPFLQWLDAEIDFLPIMTTQDLRNASPNIQSAVQHWA